MTKNDFIYALKTCGCLYHNEQIYYEENELIRMLEDLEMLEEEKPCDDAISLTKEAYSDLCLRASKADDLQRALDMEKGAYNALVKNIQCDDAISRDAVYSILKEYHIDEEEIESAMDDCQNLTVNSIASDVSLLPPVTPKSGEWIPVSERLPEVGISVLVSVADSDIYFTHITRDGVFFDEWGNKIKGIIAWMPLPEPYKAESEE